MVPADPHGLDLAQPGDDFVGMGPVAHHVAQVPHGVDVTEGREDGIERGEVGVDVREDRDPHRRGA